MQIRNTDEYVIHNKMDGMMWNITVDSFSIEYYIYTVHDKNGEYVEIR